MTMNHEVVDATDPHLWLEDVDGEAALDWVRARNAVAMRELEATPGFAALQARLLSILDSDARIPIPEQHADHLYNFWRDAANPRAIRRLKRDIRSRCAPVSSSRKLVKSRATCTLPTRACKVVIS